MENLVNWPAMVKSHSEPLKQPDRLNWNQLEIFTVDVYIIFEGSQALDKHYGTLKPHYDIGFEIGILTRVLYTGSIIKQW